MSLQKKDYIITIHEDGSFTIKSGDSIVGEQCVSQINYLQNMLGGVQVDSGYTDKYYEDEGIEVNIDNLLM